MMRRRGRPEVTLLDRLGIQVEKFGDSKGKLENLSV